jgi:hypothetical protein
VTVANADDERAGVASSGSRQPPAKGDVMHAVAEPPVTPTPVGAEDVVRPVLDQRRVVVRLRDGETILVGGSPSYEDALVLAQKTILELGDVGEGEWPMLGDRFINPDAIVSVDVLRWT